MRRLPPPLSVIEPPPSMTTSRRVLRTLAVARMRIVTGLGPHENLIRPPAGAAAGVEASPTTTASATGHAIAAPRRAVIAGMLRAGLCRRAPAQIVMSRSTGVPRQPGMNEIVIAGSTGVIGHRAVREVLAAGHRVTGVTRSARGRERLASLGARAVEAD